MPRVGKFLISPARLPPLIYYSHEMLCSLLFSLLSPGLEEHRPPQAPAPASLDSYLLPWVEPKGQKREVSRGSQVG